MKTLFLLVGFILSPTGDVKPILPKVVLGLDLCLAGIEIYEAQNPDLRLFCIDTRKPLLKKTDI